MFVGGGRRVEQCVLSVDFVSLGGQDGSKDNHWHIAGYFEICMHIIILLLFSPFIPTKPTEIEEKAIKKVDELLETYMGIRDTELGEFLADTLLQD